MSLSPQMRSKAMSFFHLLEISLSFSLQLFSKVLDILTPIHHQLQGVYFTISVTHEMVTELRNLLLLSHLENMPWNYMLSV